MPYIILHLYLYLDKIWITRSAMCFFVFSHCIFFFYGFPVFVGIWRGVGSRCGSTVLSQLPLRHKLSPVGNQACHNAKNNCHQLPSLAVVPAKNTGLSLSTKEPKYELMAHSSKSCILQKPNATLYWKTYFYRVLTICVILHFPSA